MGNIMLGADVAKAMKEELIHRVSVLKEQQITPALTIIRVGARPDDLSYERGAKKRMELVGVDCHVAELPEDISQTELEETFRQVNEDPAVHGILLFRPLPKRLDEQALCRMIDPAKDVDGICPENIAKIFVGDEDGFAPCTAEAVIRMLDHYEIPIEGKNVTIVGRSLVIGRPLAMMLLQRNATVTTCHTKTKDLADICRRADILVASAGKARMIGADMVGEQSVLADVGINVDENGSLCGDIDYENVCDKAAYISPVPRGVGSITTSILAEHVIRAAERLKK